jgi:signal transduction histidine kinase
VTTHRPLEVRRRSIRVALGATAVVGLAYLAIAVAVVAFVTMTLTAQIDARLTTALRHEPDAGHGDEPFEPPPGDRPFGLDRLILSWTIESSGDVRTAENIPDLPAAYHTIGGPQTIVIDGREWRAAGATVGDDYVVVAQTLDSVSDARSTVVVGELLIGPVLLAIVFLGAFAIGRRVATPIDLARRRQLEFTADASHELRTPLAVIEAQTSLALAHDRDAAWYRTAFGRVDHESKRMRRLLEDLLWLARFDATQAPPNVEPVDLAVLAARAADRFGPVAEARRLRLEVAQAGPDAVVAVPPEWLDRLLGVLIDNACKYSPEGGAVAIGVTADAARVRLVVDDAGPGIPEAERSRIFDRFHRATEGPGGAGLGLAIADAIVRATGGEWSVGRSPAGGARMSVTWPSALGGEREASGTRSKRTVAGTG